MDPGAPRKHRQSKEPEREEQRLKREAPVEAAREAERALRPRATEIRARDLHHALGRWGRRRDGDVDIEQPLQRVNFYTLRQHIHSLTGRPALRTHRSHGLRRRDASARRAAPELRHRAAALSVGPTERRGEDSDLGGEVRLRVVRLGLIRRSRRSGARRRRLHPRRRHRQVLAHLVEEGGDGPGAATARRRPCAARRSTRGWRARETAPATAASVASAGGSAAARPVAAPCPATCRGIRRRCSGRWTRVIGGRLAVAVDDAHHRAGAHKQLGELHVVVLRRPVQRCRLVRSRLVARWVRASIERCADAAQIAGAQAAHIAASASISSCARSKAARGPRWRRRRPRPRC